MPAATGPDWNRGADCGILRLTARECDRQSRKEITSSRAHGAAKEKAL
jgi:hypothetical protein